MDDIEEKYLYEYKDILILYEKIWRTRRTYVTFSRTGEKKYTLLQNRKKIQRQREGVFRLFWQGKNSPSISKITAHTVILNESLQ